MNTQKVVLNGWIAILIGVVGVCEPLFSQSLPQFQWLRTYAIQDKSELSISNSLIAPSGGVYISGYVQGQYDFDPGPDTVTLHPGQKGCGYVAKLAADGTLVWVRAVETSTPVFTPLMTVDSNDQLTILYYTSDSVTLHSSHDSLTLYNHDWRPGGYFARYDRNGDLRWGHVVGRIYNGGMVSGTDGSFYLTASYQDSTSFDPSNPNAFLKLGGKFNTAFCKYDSNCSLLWVRRIWGTLSSALYSASIDGEQKISIGGTASAGTYFVDARELPIASVKSINGAIVLRFDSSGTFSWARSFDGYHDSVRTSYMTSCRVAAGPQGSTFCSLAVWNSGGDGSVTDTLDIDPGNGVTPLPARGISTFGFAKLDSNGDLIWGKRVGDFPEGGERGKTYSYLVSLVGADSHGNAYFTGYIDSACSFWTSQGRVTFTTNGRHRTIYGMIGADSAISFITLLPSDASQEAGIISDGSSLYLTGMFTGDWVGSDTSDFDPGPGSVVYNIPPTGASFVARYSLSESLSASPSRSVDGHLSTVRVSPMPALRAVTIESIRPMVGLSVFSTTGVRLRTYRAPASTSWVINVTDLRPGVYTVVVNTTDGDRIARFIKE